MKEGWIEVYKTHDFTHANLIKLKIESEGIPLVLHDQRDSVFNNFGYILLYAQQENVVKVTHIIDSFNE